MRTLRPTPEIYAFYDGRVEGYSFGDAPNWVDEGALSLGIASHAIVDGDEALIYDTHISVDHARHVRRTLEQDGVSRFTVLLSHWHLDHVAGTAAFADCEILAGRLTAELLAGDTMEDTVTFVDEPEQLQLAAPRAAASRQRAARADGAAPGSRVDHVLRAVRGDPPTQPAARRRCTARVSSTRCCPGRPPARYEPALSGN
jgi:glyoxylase-like metal-dependent hydrolase (beta-lactamase superfamily II)